MARDLDLLLFGATGFTGRLAAAYLREHAPPSVRWAVAGRDPARLAAVAADAGDVPAVVADVHDTEAVGRAVARTRVVASTAGPFALHGDPVVDACVEHRTHYADITGETAWVRRVIERHHERARAEGTRVVPFCGFDSVPADLGVLRLARAAQAPLVDVSAVYRLRGGLNGGTLASALHLAEQEDRSALADPYLLAPGVEVDGEERRLQQDPRRAEHRPEDGWVAPFFMGSVNRRVVMRSHHLASEHPPPGPDGTPTALAGYGERFRYREFQGTGGRWSATATTLALGALEALLQRRLGRALLRRLGPSPGQGPSESERFRGRTRATFRASTEGGENLELALEAAGDPGNTVTVRCLCEAALALCEPPAALGLGEPDTGGVLTPALALGEFLLARLEATGRFATE